MRKRAVDGFHRGNDLREGEGAGGIAGRDLPELAHALEIADVEGVQADQLAWDLRFDVAGAAVAGLPEATTRALGEQAGRSSAVVFDNGQPLMPRGEAAAPKQAMDGAGSHTHLTSGQLRRQTPGTPRRPGQSHAQNGLLFVSFDLRWPPAPAPPPARMQSLGPVLRKLLLPTVEQRSGDPELPADLTGVAQLYSSIQRPKTKPLYPLLEGHRPSSLSSFAEEQTLGRLGPLTLVSSPARRPHEVSTPLRDTSP